MYRCSAVAHAVCPYAKYCEENAVYFGGSWCDQFNDAVNGVAAHSNISLADIINAFTPEDDGEEVPL